MIHFKSNILVLITVILLSNYDSLFSQSICPPDTGQNCTPWTMSSYQTATEEPDCFLTVNYRWRNCNGNYQIYIDNYTAQGNCTYLNQGAGGFQDWVNLLLIEELLNLEGQAEPANCPDSTTKAIFYSASCGLWVNCEYTIDSTSRVCDIDWRGNYPEYESGGVKKLSIWQWQFCGLTCCKKTYTICKYYNSTNQSYDLFIKSIIKEQIGDCANPENFTKPCLNGC